MALFIVDMLCSVNILHTMKFHCSTFLFDSLWQDNSRSTLVQSGNGLLADGTKPLPESMSRARPFSKSSLARLQEFWNSSICLYEIKETNLSKSTCPTGSFTWPGPSGSGKRRALMSCGIHLRAFSGEMLMISLLDMSLKICNLRLQVYHPGVDELTHLPLVPCIYVSSNRVSVGSDNSLSPIRTKPLSEAVLGYCQLDP